MKVCLPGAAPHREIDAVSPLVFLPLGQKVHQGQSQIASKRYVWLPALNTALACHWPDPLNFINITTS
jgi:hypothetical protein